MRVCVTVEALRRNKAIPLVKFRVYVVIPSSKHLNAPGLMEDGGNELNTTRSLPFRSLLVLIKYSTRQKVVESPKRSIHKVR